MLTSIPPGNPRLFPAWTSQGSAEALLISPENGHRICDPERADLGRRNLVFRSEVDGCLRGFTSTQCGQQNSYDGLKVKPSDHLNLNQLLKYPSINPAFRKLTELRI